MAEKWAKNEQGRPSELLVKFSLSKTGRTSPFFPIKVHWSAKSSLICQLDNFGILNTAHFAKTHQNQELTHWLYNTSLRSIFFIPRDSLMRAQRYFATTNAAVNWKRLKTFMSWHSWPFRPGKIVRKLSNTAKIRSDPLYPTASLPECKPLSSPISHTTYISDVIKATIILTFMYSINRL